MNATNREEIEIDGINLYSFPEHGCFWGLDEDKVLFYCAMLNDGTADKDTFGDVEVFGEKELETAKAFFGDFNSARICIEK